MSLLTHKFACLANLPAMPVLLMDALDQLNGNQNVNSLIDKISQDPSLVLRLLRIANSPFYGMPREIGSLRETVVLLGFNRVRDLLISICFSNSLPVRHKDFSYQVFWHHSMAVAECSKQLAALASINPDFAFTAGLLHDIGRLLIVVLFPDEFSQIIRETSTSLIETERRILGFDHAAFGGMAAQHWNLPVIIQEAIEQHEKHTEPLSAKSLELAVYTANLLIVNAEQPEAYALSEHAQVCAALALLNVSIDQAIECTKNAQQFTDFIHQS